MDGLITAGAIALLLLGAHTVFAVYVYRVMSSKADDGSDSDSTGAVDQRKPDAKSPPAADDRNHSTADNHDNLATVPCPTCGAPNDPSFQFCRDCVSELSGSGPSATKQAS